MPWTSAFAFVETAWIRPPWYPMAAAVTEDLSALHLVPPSPVGKTECGRVALDGFV
jgi:hypothetical protein